MSIHISVSHVPWHGDQKPMCKACRQARPHYIHFCERPEHCEDCKVPLLSEWMHQ